MATENAKTQERLAVGDFVQTVVDSIRDGTLDSHISIIDDALDARANAWEKEKRNGAKKNTKAATTEKKLPVAPKKKRTVATVVPEVDKTYRLDNGMPKLGGIDVKFLRYRKDGETVNEKKSIVELLSGVPGHPKGKNVSVPTTALRKIPVTRKKKVVAKK